MTSPTNRLQWRHFRSPELTGSALARFHQVIRIQFHESMCKCGQMHNSTHISPTLCSCTPEALLVLTPSPYTGRHLVLPTEAHWLRTSSIQTNQSRQNDGPIATVMSCCCTETTYCLLHNADAAHFLDFAKITAHTVGHGGSYGLGT